MNWTHREAKLVREIGKHFGLDLRKIGRAPVGLGRTLADPQETLLARLDRSLSCESEEGSEPSLKSLASFAHFNEISTDDEFWALKALVLIVQQHPYFAAGSDKISKKGPAVPRPVRDADLHEWWIQANWLRAYLQIRSGKEVRNLDLALEMAKRENSLSGDPEQWTVAQQDKIFDKDQHNFLRTLEVKRASYAGLLRRHNFKLPSMRENSRHLEGVQGATRELKWALSQTEREVDGCLEAFKNIRQKQWEKAKLSPRRSRSETP